ncbi:hypothetical protein ACFWYW_47005 [Nonomuraea sp. NPDC059023]|uniref:hypothetical protein n=1 Tax=unclassified Nonomuraea TaxID=2593643 RepID=UPI0036BFA78E
MKHTAKSLADAYGIADQAHRQAQKIAQNHQGEVAAYTSLRIAAAHARDHYAIWADVMGPDAVAEDIKDLGRIIRDWFATLENGQVYGLAIEYGFPFTTVGYVSSNALRFWLNTAYPDDHDKKTHIVNVSQERYDEMLARVAEIARQMEPIVEGGVRHVSGLVVFTRM